METFIFYLLRASVYLLVFGLGYYLLLARQNARIFNRFYILLSFVLSLVLAGVGRISLDVELLNNNDYFARELPEFLVLGRAGADNAGNWLQNTSYGWLYWIPLVLTGACLVVLLIRMIKLFRYIRQNPKEKLDSMEIVFISPQHSPFSFFHWIFIPANLKDSVHFQKVITHEKAHYILYHSWDVMFMEIIRLIFWFHPLYYYLKRDLQTIHEYDADNFALKKYSRADYQTALLDFALNAHYLPITNPFNVSTIKKRFNMMNTTQKANLKSLWIRLMVILPVILFVFALQSFTGTSKTVDLIAIVEVQPEPKKESDDQVFTVVENIPEYPGGQAAMMNFLSENLRYPEKARTDSVQGTVFVTFVVEKDGNLSNTRILRGVSPELDAETIRVVTAMPAWIPGKQRGEAVRVQFNLPIRFVLN